MKTEKLLTLAIAFEFFVLALGGAIFILGKQHAPIENQKVVLPNIELPREDKVVDLPVEVEKTTAQWAFQIQDVASDVWNYDVEYDIAEDIYIYSNIWAQFYDIDIETVLAQCGQESWFTPGLSPQNKNGTKDYGVMGVNDLGIIDFNNAHWKAPVTVEQVQHDINIGIMVGCWNYANKRRILEGWGIPATEENILYAYNGGQGRVRDNRVPEKTKKYYQDVQNIKTLFL